MGYERAMKRAGLPVSEALMIEKGFSQTDGYECGQYLLSLPERPTAICCANDLVAFGVLGAASAAGLSVPGDVSVTGMDDIPFSSVSLPKLTTITNDSTEFAQYAHEMLFDRISGRYTGQPREVEIERELVARDSTCAPKSGR